MFVKMRWFQKCMLLIVVSFFSFQGIAVASDDYSFKVHNKTSVGITKVLVKEAGGSWGAFDVGTMIKPGATAKLVWAGHTNTQDCEQWIKVVYADGSETKAAKFDFCETDLEIEFE